MKAKLCVVALSALALAACAAHPAAPQATVPTLSTSVAASAQASADPGDGRPRERLDMTNEEAEALDAPYEQCLSAHGFTKQTQDDDTVHGRAQAACLSKLPLPPWELDASNPHASDFVHAVVVCLRGKGVKYVEEQAPDGGQYGVALGGANNDRDSITKGMELTPVCEKEVAAKGIGR